MVKESEASATTSLSSPANGSVFGPTRGKERIVLLDALRGFALFGVVLVNLRDLSLFSFLSETGRNSLSTAPWDHRLDLVMTGLVDVKAFTIFTLLFGVGFALQAQRADAAGRSMSRYVRRLTILLGIGLLHAYVFWWGDILRLYALLGLLLLPLHRLKPRALATLGVITAVFVTPFLRPIMSAWLPITASSDSANATALIAFQGTSLPAMLRANFAHDVWTRITAWGLPFYVLGRLLIGAALGKSRVLWEPQEHRRFWISLLFILSTLGLALTAFVMLRDNGAFGPMQGWWQTEQARIVVRLARSAASLALGLGYVALFVLLFQRLSWRRWLARLAPVGRMALTNYIMQTVIALALFYGIGLGIGPRFGLLGVIATGTVIFFVQIMMSRWWLERFHFGPLEWVWRTLTYGTRPLMRRL
ncbi:MAG: DUF418 domain-containing protein [Verrucomicrobiota bacterium]